ncbi:retrovirus-related pol polyprotein from transposon TNT 1-94 [Tanacetum coccineum]|uniref:Retrovirus-related pol polyprotein from transposon TNT 1-94 n=1 Tax=Tanacetum coccineum TaxID=301880 RepID=A0ABQ4WHG0_9ASTR
MVVLTKRIDDMSKGKSEKGKSEKGLIDESFDWDDEFLSSEDEGITKIRAFMAIAEDEPFIRKVDARSGQWVNITMKKADESSSMLAPEITSDSKFERDTQEPLPPLPKLIGAKPTSISISLISLADLRTKMADLTLNTTKSTRTNKRFDKKADTSTEQLLLTLMEEDYLKRSVWYLDSGCSRHMTWVKQYLHRYSKESCPKVVFGDKSSSNTEGYGSVNYNGITFTRVAYVNGLKDNLISISQLCDANFKVLFTKTQRTIFNKNDEVVLLAPIRRDVYVIDMSSYNEESNTYGKPHEVRVKELRSDNGIEFRNHNLESFCDEKGEAVNTACYTQNRSIKVKWHGKTAYDVFRGRSPNISYFHVFGCFVHIHNHMDHLGKFDEKADNEFFLGYSPMAKAFRDYGSPEDTPELIILDDQPTPSKDDHRGLADGIDPNEVQDYTISKIQTCPTQIIPSAETNSQPFVPQDICAFLNGKISEEVYMQQPPRFERSEHPDTSLSECLSEMPYASPNNLGPNESGVSVNKALFRGMIRPLMYLTTSRPDIQFSTCLCARYQANPKESHLVSVKRIFRYLKGTPNIGLWYHKGSCFHLKAYSDSDYAGCNLDRKSTLGGCQILGGKLVCQSAKKQSSVAMSSSKAEYVAGAG